MSKWFTDQSYEATTLREVVEALRTVPQASSAENGGALLACPFCGGSAVRIGGSTFWIECTRCVAKSSQCATGDKAAELWNLRAGCSDRNGARNLAQNGDKGTTLGTARVTQILEKHIKLEWLNASDGKPDIVGIEEAAAELLRAEPQESQVCAEPVRVSIKPMALSDGSTDYYVALTVGKREITPYKFKEGWQAEYEADSFRWLLLGAPKPDLLAYGPTDTLALSRPQRGTE
jgi:hypothetical protein